MKAANIPYLYTRNGIYYYRNQSVWQSLRTRSKKEAFRKLSFTLFDTTPAIQDTTISPTDTSQTPKSTKLTTILTPPSTCELIKGKVFER